MAISSSLHGKLTLCLKRVYHWNIYFLDNSIPVLPPNFFAKYKKSFYSLSLNSCTAALHLSLKVLNIKKGDEIITTPFTYVATAEAIVQCGAKPIFVDAIKKMTIKDAISIVKGDSTAGTDYLNKNTNSALVEAFKPIIKSSLQKVKATKYWKDIMGVYNKIPSVKKINPDLEYYVARKAIEGLFFMIAEEEIEIRKNPQKRITELLKKVFGS